MLPYIVQAVIILAVPTAFIVALYRGQEPDRVRWLLKALYSGIFIAYLLLAGRWDFVSVYFRYVVAIAYCLAVLKSCLQTRGLPWVLPRRAGSDWAAYATYTVLVFFFGAFFASALRGWHYSGHAVELEFPLGNEWAYVGQGGNSTSINYHNTLASQRFALDIVALNDLGVRARGMLPENLQRYIIFGARVYSPCDGMVTHAVDQFPDQVPPQTDKDNVAGNHVVIACKGALVLLAHLRRGSVSVREGQTLHAGALVGTVGNSGNTSEPHLHIHAVRADSGDVLSGKGIPITFDGWFPVRNSTQRLSLSHFADR